MFLQTFSVLWMGVFAPDTEIDNHCSNYFHSLINNTPVKTNLLKFSYLQPNLSRNN